MFLSRAFIQIPISEIPTPSLFLMQWNNAEHTEVNSDPTSYQR